MRIGSLCSGYGGLELAVQAAVGGDVAWHSEVDPAASRVLAHHWPDVPNLGDMTRVDWSSVEPIDVLAGGTPCQDVSHAGRRAGMRAGTRSGLWSAMVDAIDVLRPRLVVWENVRGVLSAEADSGMEPCPLCVGDGTGPALRALGRVLGDLAELGYDAQWCGLRAADVGAPHGRFRVFVVAWDTQNVIVERGRSVHGVGARDARPTRGADGPTVADTDSATCGQRGIAAPGQTKGGRSRADAGGRSGALAPDARGERWNRRSEVRRSGRSAPLGLEAGDHAGHTGRHSVANAASDGWHEGRSEPTRQLGRPDAAERSASSAADTDVDGLAQLGRIEPNSRDTDGRDGADTAWGPYEPAIRRWETVIGRSAPAPTEPGSRGGQRLSPRFVEWMMGLPDGWVTDVPGTTRNDQLKMLGNGVVPQQGAAAINYLLRRQA